MATTVAALTLVMLHWCAPDAPRTLGQEPTRTAVVSLAPPAGTEPEPSTPVVAPDGPAEVGGRDGRQLPGLQLPGLRLEDLQATALVSNPSVHRASAIIQAARGNALQVGLQDNPSVGLDFQQLFSGGQAEQYGVALEQRFVRREKLDLNRTVAMHEVRRLEQELESVRRRVLTDVHVAFVQALRAQRQIDVALELAEINRAALEVSQQLFAADEVARTDVLQAELEVATATLLLRDAENRHIAAWRQLQYIAGQPELPPQALAGDLFEVGPLVDFEQALMVLRSRSPEVSERLAAIERARCNVRRQQMEPLPDVSVSGLLNWRDNGIDGNADAGLAMMVPLPLNDRNQGAVHEARYALLAAERSLEQLELSLAARLTPVFERYAMARQQVESYQVEILPRAAETLDLIRETYELGEVAFERLLTAQRTYAQLRLTYIDSLENLHVAHAQIDGLLLTGALDARSTNR